MIELSINNLTKFYGANKIFETITFDVKTGERIGLIGQNGCGKTTIMKILMGQEEYQGGEITFRKDTKVGYLNQIPVYEDQVKTIDVVRSAFEQIFEIKKTIQGFEKKFSLLEGNDLEKALFTYGKLTDEYEIGGGYELETKINKLTEGLGITESMKEMNFNQLSGGEKTRVILAKILLEEPDILLLDEPTNHLDLITIDWLEGFLKEYKGSVLIISHDRYFLDKVVNRIVELEFSKANNYVGNYSYYVVEKERRFLIEYRNYMNQQKKIEQMERQIQRYRIWGEMRDSEKMFKKAKELEKRLEKMDVFDKPTFEKRKVKFGQNTFHRTGKIVIEAEHISKSYEDLILIKDANFTIFYQDSACIIGKNGCGKSTLLKMILGEVEPDNGVIKIGSQVKIGYLPQHVEYEDEEQTLLEYFVYLHDTTYEIARSQLAKVLFYQEDVNKKIKFLSGGEKSRLRLCSLTFEGVNVMILDEPTNHLDIDSREVLEETLNEFQGTLLFVSHDRYFINKIADKILFIENNNLQVFAGDYSNYLEEYQKLLNQDKTNQEYKNTPNKYDKDKTSQEKVKTTHGKINQNKTNNNKAQYITKKLEQLEMEIEEVERIIKILDEEMLKYNSDVQKLKELYEEKEKNGTNLTNLYKMWEELQI